MTPGWHEAFNCQKYPAYTEYLPPRHKFHSISLYDHLFSRYKVDKSQKCTEWLQALNCQKYLAYIEYSPLRSEYHSVLFYEQPLSRYKIVVENRKCTEWLQNDFKHLTVKSTLHTLNTHNWDPNFTPFRSTVARFPDNWDFWFLIGYNDDFQKIFKTQKLKISKLQKRYFCEDHWEENSRS